MSDGSGRKREGSEIKSNSQFSLHNLASSVPASIITSACLLVEGLPLAEFLRRATYITPVVLALGLSLPEMVLRFIKHGHITSRGDEFANVKFQRLGKGIYGGSDASAQVDAMPEPAVVPLPLNLPKPCLRQAPIFKPSNSS